MDKHLEASKRAYFSDPDNKFIKQRYINSFFRFFFPSGDVEENWKKVEDFAETWIYGESDHDELFSILGPSLIWHILNEGPEGMNTLERSKHRRKRRHAIEYLANIDHPLTLQTFHYLSNIITSEKNWGILSVIYSVIEDLTPASLNDSFETLEPTVRLWRLFDSLGFKTIGDIVSHSREELVDMFNQLRAGKKKSAHRVTMKEITKKLERLGFELKD